MLCLARAPKGLTAEEVSLRLGLTPMQAEKALQELSKRHLAHRHPETRKTSRGNASVWTRRPVRSLPDYKPPTGKGHSPKYWG